MNNSKFNFDIAPSNPDNPIGIEVWVNDQQLINCEKVVEKQSVPFEFDDDVEQTFCVKIVVKNKTDTHTKINSAGEIVEDSLLSIDNFTLDGINIDQVVNSKAIYRHNFNNTGPWTDSQFFNTIGCNGTVMFEFAAPGYLWLLENT